MIEDILVPIIFGTLLWFWGNWLQKTVHKRRKNDTAQLPGWIHNLLFPSKMKVSASGLMTKLFSIIIYSKILVELNIITVESWKKTLSVSILPMLLGILVLVNWGRWFRYPDK